MCFSDYMSILFRASVLHRSAICVKLFSGMVLHRSMVKWRKGPFALDICAFCYMLKLIWCSGIT